MPQFPANLNLSELDGVNGFQINGESDLITGISDAGDLNGDGFADLILSASGASGEEQYAGKTYVVLGKASGFAAELELSALNGANGFRILGAKVHDFSGSSIDAAGDVNGDGFEDLIIGARGGGSFYEGTSYVVFGRHGFSSSINLSGLNGANGYRLDGIDRYDNASLVSGAGDFNGDGFDDFLIGAGGGSPGGNKYAGESYLIFGGASGFPELSKLDGVNGFRLDGIDRNDRADWVKAAGDVNGDGFDDISIGAGGGDPGGRIDAGECYIVFGKAGANTAALDLSTLNGANGFRLDGLYEYDRLGPAANAGDVNGDGFTDLILECGGEAYVVFGKASGFAASFDLSGLDGSNGFRITGERIDSVGGTGDVNGDGFDDIIVGNPLSGSGTGVTYVVFGQAVGFSATLDLSTLDGSNGFTINGEIAGDQAGSAVSAAGDVNGDGFADMLIGARFASPGGVQGGAGYVVYGHEAQEAVVRTGTAIANRINGGVADDTVNGLGGDDTLFGRGGSDVILGEDGDDILDGGVGNDVADGGAGNDLIALGDGHDMVIASSGDDVVDGGAGKDTVDLRSFGSAPVFADLLNGVALLANGDAMTLAAIEQVRGTKGNDTILGDERGNTLLEGGKGDDIIDGRGGGDFIAGNGGRDIMTGGAGADRFDFNWVSDSGTGAATRDVITDFKRGGEADRVDLATIDAIAGGGTANDGFSFVSGGFTAAGQVRVVQAGANTIVEINTSGADGAEMTILLTGVVAGTIRAADFWL